MVSFISKFLFTATVTAPTFLSLGLIGVIKDSTNYFQLWDDMLENKIFPTSFEWWGINISFGFMLICLIGIKIFLYRKSNKHKEGKTIQVKSYSNLSLNSAEQIISSIIPWLTIFADKLDFMVLFVCIILQCCFIAIASYNNNISAFMRKAPRTKTSLLNKYGVNAQINENKELVLPTNNVADLNRVLEFLNEDIFRGVITDRLYRSNSKKKDNH